MTKQVDLTVDIKVPKWLRKQVYNLLVSEQYTKYFSVFQMYKGGVLRRVFAASLTKNYYAFMEVLREHEFSSEKYYRNMYFTNLGGWRIMYPNHPAPLYYGSTINEDGPWYPVVNCNLQSKWMNPNKCEKIGGSTLKYFWRKVLNTNVSEHDIIQMIRNYRKNAFIELLIQRGYKNLAASKMLLKLNTKKQEQLIHYLNSNEPGDYSISYVLHGMKYKIPIHRVSLHQYCLKNNVDFEYMSKHPALDLNLYLDYLGMCRKLNINVEDPYWKYPSNLYERHQHVMIRVERMEKSKKDNYVKTLNRKIKKILPSLIDIEQKKDDIEIVFPRSMQEIEIQAEKLHQCLITANYHKKYANNQIYLVFIKRGETPLATAEIFTDSLKIGQFYGNELDRRSCMPSDDVKKVFNDWYENIFIPKHLKEVCA